jgi:CRISPR-associated protein Cas2
MRLVVAYDVSDDANRREVFDTLEAYGAWQQYSVFEVEIGDTDRLELEHELESHIEPEDGDRIRIYRLCDGCLDDTSDLGADPPGEQSNVI